MFQLPCNDDASAMEGKYLAVSEDSEITRLTKAEDAHRDDSDWRSQLATERTNGGDRTRRLCSGDPAMARIFNKYLREEDEEPVKPVDLKGSDCTMVSAATDDGLDGILNFQATGAEVERRVQTGSKRVRHFD